MNSITISYFAIANIFILFWFKGGINVLSNGYLLKYYLMIGMIFKGIFILQFKNEKEVINKFIYTLSTLLITAGFMNQNLFELYNFRLEYYLLIITMALFVLDKLIWELEYKTNKYIYESIVI